MRWRRIVVALFFGLASAVFADAYWLSEIFAPQSRRLIAGVVLIGALATAIAFFLYAWAEKRWQTLGVERRKLLGGSLLLGTLLLFGGTSQWFERPLYVTSLLPTHHLEIEVLSDTEVSLQLVWFTTSLGDVSFNELKQSGWQRKEDTLNLRTPSNNRLEWTGKTGKEVQIVFQSNQSIQLQLIWNGQKENIEIPKGRYVYRKTLSVPLYASTSFVLTLGWGIFGALSLALLLWIWPERTRWTENITRWLISDQPYAHWEIVLLIGVGLLAFLLRAWNLENTFPAVDEYRHLFAARQMLEEGSLPEYRRSFWTVTVPVMIAFRMWGVELWSARLMGVIFNVLGLIPFYLVARKFNRTVAIWAAFLYATNPLLIFFARMVREYAYYPFYFSLIAYIMIAFLERFPSKFSFRHQRTDLLSPRLFIPVLLLGLPIAYAIYDNLSTFKLIFFSYLSLVVAISTKIDWQDRINRALGIFGLVLGVIIVSLQYAAKNFILTFRIAPLSYFFFNPPEQWYFNRGAVLAILAISVYIYFSFTTRVKCELLAFIQANFLIYLAFFTFTDSLSRPFRLRHMMITEIWFVLIMAVGSLLLWRFIVSENNSRSFRALALGVFLLAFMNPSQILAPSTSTGSLPPVSEDFVPNETALHTFMLTNARPDDILIASTYRYYVLWTRRPTFSAIYQINTTTSLDEVKSLIHANPSGWIAIDSTRISVLTFDPFRAFDSLGLEYLGTFGDENDEYLWRWQR